MLTETLVLEQGQLPNASLEIRRTDGTAQILVEEASSTAADRDLFAITNNGSARIIMTDNNRGESWDIGTAFASVHSISSANNGAPLEFNFITDWKYDHSPAPLTTRRPHLWRRLCGCAERRRPGIWIKCTGLPVYAFTLTDTRESEDGLTAQEVTAQHYGPDAAEFNAQFGLGAGDGIAPLDVAAVALMGVQELRAEKDAEIAALQEQNAELEARITSLEKMVQELTLTTPPSID